MDFIQKVITNVNAESLKHGTHVSDRLAAFICRAVLLEEPERFDLDSSMTDEDIDDLVALAVHKILKRDDPSIETIKMQVAFENCEREMENLFRTRNNGLANQIDVTMTTIISMKTDISMNAVQTLYRKIFSLLLLKAGFKSKSRVVEREVAAALESVFPRIGLKSFISMGEDEKRMQLLELLEVVTGIRLFNKNLKKGGAEIPDTINEAPSAANRLQSALQSELKRIGVDIEQCSELLLPGNQVSGAPVSRLNQELTNRRQYFAFASVLLEETTKCKERIGKISGQYQSTMSTLRELIGSRVSVPKEQVYPKFHTLSTLWAALTAETELIDAKEQCWNVLKTFKSSYASVLQSISFNHNLDSTEKVVDSLEEEPTRSGASEEILPIRNSLIKEDVLIGSASDAVRLHIDSSPEFMQLPLEMQGYCPYTIATKSGLLLPGNPGLGVVRFNNRFFVFVSEEAIAAFIRSPATILRELMAVVIRRAELIPLLRLDDYLSNGVFDSVLKDYDLNVDALLHSKEATVKDASTGTPIHFVEKNIDPNYHWNEWDLRRKAIKIVNLRKVCFS
eukprot:TRINITY_DN3771_c0_g1_i2.p1 TRINITY_DN3771_c0_g1~~TRINITY_DN3771_c0_g1_i2.p1  ORF type:complete len:566 (-),score=119.00 TRINITY_DN3771_c0_g1_i2:662-2359(-)